MQNIRYGNVRVFVASEHYVTSADIEGIINRALKNVATKDDIKSLKADIASVHNRMDSEFKRFYKVLGLVQSDVRKIKEEINPIEDSDSAEDGR